MDQVISIGSIITLESLNTALTVLYVLLGVLVVGSIALTLALGKRKRNKNSRKFLLGMCYVVTVVVLVCTVLCVKKSDDIRDQLQVPPSTSHVTPTEDEVTNPTEEPTEEPTTEPTVAPLPTFTASFIDQSNPSNWKVNWSIYQEKTKLDSFLREETISFGAGSDYAEVEGVLTFRGNNYRDGASYGITNVQNFTLTKLWNNRVGSLRGSHSNWTGCGWTGQPLVVRWPAETKAIMNMYPEKQAKADLVEVIYATLDGYVYFYDLEDGTRTRPAINVGMNFKGAGSIDPRGYPLMYVGSGDNRDGQRARMYIISLIDGKILYEQSGKDSATSRAWYAFDSAPLVDAKTDTLIWPGENGVLYTIKLNTVYDKAAGTISVNPENVAKTVYKASTGTKVGYEASGIVVDGYFYCADNSGLFVCVDLNTMELKWAQDVQDDINATPVFEWGNDGVGYIYCGTSMEYAKGNVFIYKMRADNGEIVWERKFTNITYNELVSGGVMSSPIIGKKGTDLENLLIFPIARTPSTGSGTIFALDKETGETVWSETNKNYHWSSPVAVYTEDNKGYILLGDSAGKITMYDSTGKSLTSIGLGSNIEASPAVFENRLVVGTRGAGIFGIEIG